jgi:thioredoxin 1
MLKSLLIFVMMCLMAKGYTMTFEEITSADKAVIRFTATWCPPCKALAPIFDEVAAENPEVTTFIVDVDTYPELAQKFGVRGIPTLMRIEKGSVKMQTTGAQPKPEVEKLFK